MSVILPMQAVVLQPRFFLLFLLLTFCFGMGRPLPLRRNIIKVRTSGFLPFESDLVLPLGILRHLQAQDRASRLLPPAHHTKSAHRTPKPKVKQQVRLERAPLRGQSNTDAGIQLYNLIDDDGELLLNLRVHTDPNINGNNHGLGLSESKNPEKSNETPWRPSRWRPTTSKPMATSSSPRPLPLHQYLTKGNSADRSALTQQRRMFGTRPDWMYHGNRS